MILTIWKFSVCTTTKDLQFSSSFHQYYYFFNSTNCSYYVTLSIENHHSIAKKNQKKKPNPNNPPKSKTGAYYPFKVLNLNLCSLISGRCGGVKNPLTWSHCDTAVMRCKHRTMLEFCVCVCVCVHEVITPPPGSLAANASQCSPSGR